MSRREAVADILTRPLDALVVATDRVVAPAEVVDAWSIDSTDRQALVRWGLPLLEEGRLIPNIQDGVVPEIATGMGDYYGLGLFFDYEIGVDPVAGEVIGIPIEEVMPGSSFINSSVTLFVEAAWRWYWVLKEVRELRFDIEQYDLIDDFLEFVVRIDGRVASEEGSFWRGLGDSW